jgi:hypothetical protein
MPDALSMGARRRPSVVPTLICERETRIASDLSCLSAAWPIKA